MVIKQWKEKIADIFKKYKYAVIILLFGVLLMLLPINGKTPSNSNTPIPTMESEVSLEERLSKLLSLVEGAGEVKVILTVSAGEEVIYQTNTDNIDNDTSFTDRSNTVTVTDSDRNQSGLVRQVKSEIYMGAIVICNGANDPTVRLAIVEAVSRATGLGTNCISVLKMK